MNELKRKLREKLEAQHDAAEDWPDGAWWASLEDTVELFNEEHNTSYEPNDEVHKWLRHRDNG